MKSVEERLAALEGRVAELAAFDQAANNAFRQIAEQIKAFMSLASTLDREFTRFRSVQTLAGASRIFPKNRSVAFIGRDYFGDNIKYAFLAFNVYARAHGIDSYFITDHQNQYDMLTKAGFSCLPCQANEWTAQEVLRLLGTKAIVVGDNFHIYSLNSTRAFGLLQGAKTVQLWHGIPIKQIGLGYVMRGDNVIPEELIASSGPFDLFVAPGKEMREEWRHQFAFKDFAAIGYPRNDVFFREPTAEDMINVDRECYDLFTAARREGKPTVLYVPTYRDDAGLDWYKTAGLAAMAEHCRIKGYVFAINLHPHEHQRIEALRAVYPSVRFLAPFTDAYPVVRHTDILITDYSSLMFDFLLLDRPVVFYRADECITKQRGFIEGRINMTPGAVAGKADELFAAVDAAVTTVRDPKSDRFRNQRQKLCAELYDHKDGKAGERLNKEIEKLLAD